MQSGDPVRRVAVVGGTHGNELAGPWLIDKYRRRPELSTWKSFELALHIGNPAAVVRVARYVDCDLNRSFDPDTLADLAASGYEVERARALMHAFGPNGVAPADALFDLHTTTANMGKTMILVNQDPFNLRLAAWAQARDPELRVYAWLDESLPRRSLASAFRRAATLEFGPTPQGVLRAELVAAVERTLRSCLDFVETHNAGELPDRIGSLELFQYARAVDYPRDAQGRVTAMIHPALQDGDYRPLRAGDPIFEDGDGNTVRLEAPEGVFSYPVFVNEAAYYEKGVAFCLAERQLLEV